MPFAKGQSGNPTGRPQADIVSEAMRIEAHAVVKQRVGRRFVTTTRLRAICTKVLKEAIKGEPWAVNVAFDRMVGRPMQPIMSDNHTTVEAGAVFVELLRELNEQRKMRTIEHVPDQTNGHGSNGGG